MNDKIRRITADDPPKGPCWVFGKATREWSYYYGTNWPQDCFTHYHPDQPDAPTEWPDETKGDQSPNDPTHDENYVPPAAPSVPQWAVEAAKDYYAHSTTEEKSDPNFLAYFIARHAPPAAPGDTELLNWLDKASWIDGGDSGHGYWSWEITAQPDNQRKHWAPPLGFVAPSIRSAIRAAMRGEKEGL